MRRTAVVILTGLCIAGRLAAQTTAPPTTTAPAQGLDALMHPKPLTVQVDNGKLPDIAKQINDQLGFRYLITVPDYTTNNTLMTIHAKDQPLWEILRQVNDQAEFMISQNSNSMAPVDQQHTVQFSMPTGGAVARPITVIDGMGIVTQTTGTPARGTWTVQCRVFLDPRVRVASHTRLKVDKAEDQDGHELQQAASPDAAKTMAYRAAPSFNMSAWFAAAPGVTAIKSLRGSVVLEILESEKNISLDPNDLPKEPLETPIGKLIAQKTAAGDYEVKIARPVDGAAGTGTLRVEVRSRSGRVQGFNTMNIYTGVSISARATQDSPTFELYFPEKVHEVKVPILLENVTIMPERPPLRGGGGR